MTEKLYYKDSFIKEFTAKVISCEEYNLNYAVILDRTAFFPEGGGQPSDIGTLGDAKVLDVQIKENTIYHISDIKLPVGSEVVGKLNFERRFDFMQQHSAEHIVSGIAHRLYGCENVGFHLSEEIVTLDFDKPLSKAEIGRIEAEANQKVFENKAISTYFPNGEALEKLTYRSKKELDGEIRIVEIEDTDICACCAPHTSSTGQVGLIKLLGCEALRGGVRLELKAGNRALCDYREKYENAAHISSKLCVKQSEIADAVDRLYNGLSELKAKITDLKRQSIAGKVAAFKSAREITCEFENDFEIKELQLYSDALCKNTGGIRGVFSKADGGYYFAICGNSSELDEFFKGFKQSFNVRGGGRGGMVQGTVFAEKVEIEAFFDNFS